MINFDLQLFGGKGGGSRTTNITTEPRVYNVQVQTSCYGRPIPIIFGTQKTAGNIIDYMDFTAHEHRKETTTTTGGGKGGGKKNVMTNVEIWYTYTVALDISLCDCFGTDLSQGVLTRSGQAYNVWQGSDFSNLADLNLSTMLNNVWSYTATAHPDRSSSYNGNLRAVGVFDLGKNTALPNLKFALSVYDAYDNKRTINGWRPSAVIYDLLFGEECGLDLPRSLTDKTEFEVGYIEGTKSVNHLNYAIDNNIVYNLLLAEQQTAASVLLSLLSASLYVMWFSQDRVRLTCISETTGATYEPYLDSKADIDLSMMLEINSGEFIEVEQIAEDDRYNSVKAEYCDAQFELNTDIVTVQDAGEIARRGLREASLVNLKFITDKKLAQETLQKMSQQILYGERRYYVKLPIQFAWLDPADIVTLTIPEFDWQKKKFRIWSMTYNEEWTISLKLGEVGEGITRTDVERTQATGGEKVNTYFAPDNTEKVWYIPTPQALSGGSYYGWLTASSSSLNWGGCSVWLSVDGTNYKRIGYLTGKPRAGYTTSTLPAYDTGLKKDTANTLGVDFSDNQSNFQSTTDADVDLFGTLSYIGGEFIAYRNANVTSAYNYNFSTMWRGIYGSPNKSHSIGTDFVRMDFGAMLQYQFTGNDIGKTVYVKCPAVNNTLTYEQSLADVTPFTITITTQILNICDVNRDGYIHNNTQYTSGVLELDGTSTNGDCETIQYSVGNVGLLAGSYTSFAKDTTPDPSGSIVIYSSVSLDGGNTWSAWSGVLVNGSSIDGLTVGSNITSSCLIRYWVKFTSSSVGVSQQLLNLSCTLVSYAGSASTVTINF